jgi:hypothetical protein
MCVCNEQDRTNRRGGQQGKRSNSTQTTKLKITTTSIIYLIQKRLQAIYGVDGDSNK